MSRGRILSLLALLALGIACAGTGLWLLAATRSTKVVVRNRSGDSATILLRVADLKWEFTLENGASETVLFEATTDSHLRIEVRWSDGRREVRETGYFTPGGPTHSYTISIEPTEIEIRERRRIPFL